MKVAERSSPPKTGRDGSPLPWLIASVLGPLALLAVAPSVLAQGTSLAVDADPDGNSPTRVGQINRCIAVATGHMFDVDIVVDGVDQLLAWEIYFEYDPAVVEIVDRDVRLFQEANPGSAVFDVSEALPDREGLYRAAAADTADPPSPDSGSGILARLTLRALGPGISPAALARRDLNDDGKIDQGPFLRDIDAQTIGDQDGDTFFDGSVQNAQIAVDTSCPPGSDGPGAGSASTSTGDGGVRAVYLLAPAVAAAAIAGFGATILLYRRRARTQPH